MSNKRVKPICPNCGSDDVNLVTTIVREWDVAAQEWEQNDDLCEVKEYCAECDWSIVADWVDADVMEPAVDA